jgi:hypothetical protein
MDRCFVTIPLLCCGVFDASHACFSYASNGCCGVALLTAKKSKRTLQKVIIKSHNKDPYRMKVPRYVKNDKGTFLFSPVLVTYVVCS